MSSGINFKEIAKGLAKKLHSQYGDRIFYSRVDNDENSDGVPNPHWRLYFRVRTGFFRYREVDLGCIEEDLAFNSGGYLSIKYHILHSQAQMPFRSSLTEFSGRAKLGRPVEVPHYDNGPRGNCG